MCRTIQLFRYLGLTAAPGITCKIIKHITASLSVSGLEAQDVLAKEQNARDFAMESGLAHDEASPAKIQAVVRQKLLRGSWDHWDRN